MHLTTKISRHEGVELYIHTEELHQKENTYNIQSSCSLFNTVIVSVTVVLH